MSNYFFSRFCFFCIVLSKCRSLPTLTTNIILFYLSFVHCLHIKYSLLHQAAERTTNALRLKLIDEIWRLREDLYLYVVQVWGVVMERRLRSNHRWPPCVVHLSCLIRGTIWLKSRETVQQRKDQKDSLKCRSETIFTLALHMNEM